MNVTRRAAPFLRLAALLPAVALQDLFRGPQPSPDQGGLLRIRIRVPFPSHEIKRSRNPDASLDAQQSLITCRPCVRGQVVWS